MDYYCLKLTLSLDKTRKRKEGENNFLKGKRGEESVFCLDRKKGGEKEKK